METTFQIDATWLEAPQAGVRDLAQLSLSIDDIAITQLADIEKKENRTYFRGSAVALALWLTDNWWRLRYEPVHDSRWPKPDWRMRHEMSAISGGTLWPPLMIYGTGERVMVAPAFGANLAAGPLRYLDLTTVYSLSGRSFEQGVDQFMRAVVATCGAAEDGAHLTALIEQLTEERADVGVSAWRRLEARLGYDPDLAPETLMDRLAELENRWGERAIEEAAIAAPGDRAAQTLEEALDLSANSAMEFGLGLTSAVSADFVKTSAPPWLLGEQAAHAVRKALGVTHGPLTDGALSRMVERSWDEVERAGPTARQLPYATRLRTKGQNAKVALQTSYPVDRRFEVARILGDALWTRDDAFGVISRAKTERQKFQRAFAQNLLCPFDELRGEIDFSAPTEEQISTTADRYHVRPAVVETALVVHGVLPRETLAQRLEAA